MVIDGHGMRADCGSVQAVVASVPARYRRAARRTVLRLAAVKNAGSRVECPCCGKRLKKFARFHGLSEECPGCGALTRHRPLVLHDDLDIDAGEPVLVCQRPASPADE